MDECKDCKCSHCTNEGKKCPGCFDCMWMPEDGCEYYTGNEEWECLKRHIKT